MITIQDAAKLLAVVAVWGLTFVVIKIGVAVAPPLFLTAMRFVFAAIPAVFILPRPKVALWKLGAYGVLLGVIQFGLVFSALRLGLAAGITSLVIQLQVFFTIALSAFIYGEKPKPWQLVGACVALVGAVIIGSERVGGTQIIPLLMIVGAALAWGGANLVGKSAGRVDMMSFVAWGSLAAPVPLFILSGMVEGWDTLWAAASHPSWTMMIVSAIMGWVATNGGFGIWGVMLGRYPVSTVAPFALLVPVFGFLGGAIVYGEGITLAEMIGALGIFSGLIINLNGGRWRVFNF